MHTHRGATMSRVCVSRCASNDEFITCLSLSLLLRHRVYRREEEEKKAESEARRMHDALHLGSGGGGGASREK